MTGAGLASWDCFILFGQCYADCIEFESRESLDIAASTELFKETTVAMLKLYKDACGSDFKAWHQRYFRQVGLHSTTNLQCQLWR